MEELKKLQEELGAEKLKNASLESTIEELEAEIADLTTQLEAAKTGKGSVKPAPKVVELPQTPFTVNKVEYRFTVPSFSHNGENITAQNALKDKTLLAELVEGGYGVIEKI